MSASPTRAELERDEGAGDPAPPLTAIEPADENKPVDLGRIAWLGTVLVCVITVAILLWKGYYGYALVTLAVAASAAINLRQP